MPRRPTGHPRTARGHVIPPCPAAAPVPACPPGAVWVIVRVAIGEVVSLITRAAQPDHAGPEAHAIVRVAESKAAALSRRLAARGVVSWCPMQPRFVTELGRRNRRPGWRFDPLYPGYMFAAVSPDAAGYNATKGHPGALGLVTVDGQVVTVPAHVIERIAHDEAAMHANATPVEQERPSALIGARVRLASFDNIEAVVTAAIGRDVHVRAPNGITLRVPVDKVARVA